MICEQAENEALSIKMEKVQHNAPLTTTTAIRATSQEKLYQELGFESLRTGKKIFKALAPYNILYNNENLFP